MPFATSIKFGGAVFSGPNYPDPIGSFKFDSRSRIIFFGASIMDGTSRIGGTKFKRAMFDGGHSVAVFDEGYPGEDSTQLLARAANVIATYNPATDLIFAHFPGNDIDTGVPYPNNATTMNTNYRQIITDFINAGFSICPTPLSYRTPASQKESGLYNDNVIVPAITDLLPDLINSQTQLPYVDLYSYIEANQSLLSGDGIHPSEPAGYEQVATYIGDTLATIMTEADPVDPGLWSPTITVGNSTIENGAAVIDSPDGSLSGVLTVLPAGEYTVTGFNGSGSSSTIQIATSTSWAGTSFLPSGQFSEVVTVTDAIGFKRAFGETPEDVIISRVSVVDNSQQVQQNQEPTANFSYATLDLAVTFTDSSSDSDGAVSAWNWDFGDTNTSIEQNPVHTYSEAGSYTVTLTVTDDDGATHQSQQTVTVSEAVPVPAGTPSISSLSNGSEVTLTGTDFGAKAAAPVLYDMGAGVYENSYTTPTDGSRGATSGQEAAVLQVTDPIWAEPSGTAFDRVDPIFERGSELIGFDGNYRGSGHGSFAGWPRAFGGKTTPAGAQHFYTSCQFKSNVNPQHYHRFILSGITGTFTEATNDYWDLGESFTTGDGRTGKVIALDGSKLHVALFDSDGVVSGYTGTITGDTSGATATITDTQIEGSNKFLRAWDRDDVTTAQAYRLSWTNDELTGMDIATGDRPAAELVNFEGRWNLLECYSDIKNQTTQLMVNGQLYHGPVSMPGMGTRDDAQPVVNSPTIGGWGSDNNGDNENFKFYRYRWGAIYQDTTPQRVIIANHGDLLLADKVVVQRLTSWTDTGITFEKLLMDIAEADAWVFVVNGNNVYSQYGVNISTGSTYVPPAADRFYPSFNGVVQYARFASGQGWTSPSSGWFVSFDFKDSTAEEKYLLGNSAASRFVRINADGSVTTKCSGGEDTSPALSASPFSGSFKTITIDSNPVNGLRAHDGSEWVTLNASERGTLTVDFAARYSINYASLEGFANLNLNDERVIPFDDASMNADDPAVATVGGVDMLYKNTTTAGNRQLGEV